MTENEKHNQPPAYVGWIEDAENMAELAEGLGKITTPEQAASVGEMAREAKDKLSEVKKIVTAERKPHTDAANEISANYKPAVDIFERVKSATLALVDNWTAEKRREEAAALAEARRVEREAEEAARKITAEADETDVADLAAAVEAERAAKFAAQEAKRLATKKSTVAGTQYRTVGYDIAHTDRKAHLKHVAATDPDALAAFLIDHAQAQAKRTKGAAIPGCTVEPIKRAV